MSGGVRVKSLMVVVSILLGTTGCPPAVVGPAQQTARVPLAAAPLRTGAPLDGPVELAVGATSFGALQRPRLESVEYSVEVPSEMVRGELRLRLGRLGELAVIHERGFGPYRKLDATPLSIGHATPTSTGIALHYAALYDDAMPDFHISVGLEVTARSIPFVQRQTSVDDQGNPAGSFDTVGSDLVNAVALELTPNYRHGPVTVFGGIYLTEQPVVYAVDESARRVPALWGPVQFLAHAGVQYDFGVVTLIAQIEDDLRRVPIAYGPSFGLGLAFTYRDAWRRR